MAVATPLEVQAAGGATTLLPHHTHDGLSFCLLSASLSFRFPALIKRIKKTANCVIAMQP